MSFRIPEQLLLPWHPRKSISTVKAAEMLDVSRHTVWRLIEAGEIKAYQLVPGSPWRVYYDSVIEFLERVHRKNGLDPRFHRQCTQERS